jgi:hypothetical protein
MLKIIVAAKMTIDFKISCLGRKPVTLKLVPQYNLKLISMGTSAGTGSRFGPVAGLHCHVCNAFNADSSNAFTTRRFVILPESNHTLQRAQSL